MNQLAVRNLSVAYGNIRAVRAVSLELAQGEQVCLIGANGAGKTTLLKAIAGMLPIASGSVHFEGASLTRRPSFEIVRRGIALIPEGRGIFGRLAVAENLAMGAYSRRDHAQVRADAAMVYELFPLLAERRRQTAGLLSGGEQQMLAIGRALMSRPRLLLLDEPSMGLAPLLVQRIFDTIKIIAARGVTMLLVEQNARLALQTCSRGYVMESGVITLADSARQLIDNPKVKEAYLGE
ncbi:MAG: ABC transporter ATP-binding protein [Deltaproteobacteria bacterium CG_4_10_14_3_um_filter_60_8]|nr:MAG: ABC transporter ATP-binding protein [Desulfobacterales bacterium CG2_30_60_27]PIY25616.1 MAG: ABC transporter ATP-binding protein [Deltaproteobacteria bacterium CG_4_10_14_3_um_filter_60_8]